MRDNLVDSYKAIEEVSKQMLEAARRSDWDEVARCEGASAALISQLSARIQAATEPMSAKDRAEKTRILKRILKIDAEVRVLSEPWLTQWESIAKGPIFRDPDQE